MRAAMVTAERPAKPATASSAMAFPPVSQRSVKYTVVCHSMVIFREAAWRSTMCSTQGRFILKKTPRGHPSAGQQGLGRPELVGEGGDITPPLPGRPGTNSGMTTIQTFSQ
jgi:hypothetical protein